MNGWMDGSKGGRFWVLLILLVTYSSSAWASIQTQAGPYRIDLSSRPGVIPVGQATLIFRFSSSSGKPLQGLTVRSLAQMPGMPMGEQEAEAQPVPGSPGTYQLPANFGMAGGYDVSIKISGPQGQASAKLSIETGQDLGEGAANGFSILSLVPWLLGAGILVFVMTRMRATGQKVDAHGFFSKGTIGGLVLLGAMLAIAVWVVNGQRRPGSMTPLEAQGMEMNTPAPSGSVAVELATVTRGPIVEMVKYSGQAVGFVEQDVNPRTTGVIVWMPYYTGQKVKKGQVLARLDTSQLDPQLAERAAMTNMAAQGVGVAATEYQAALQEVVEARADLAVKQSMVAESDSMIEAAKQEKSMAEAELTSMQVEMANAEAEVTAAESGAKFARDELGRMRQLFSQKAISASELQQADKENDAAQAMLHHAHQGVNGAEAKVASARAGVRKADAMVSAAIRKKNQAEADVRAGQAAIRTKQSMADAKKKGIAKEQAGVAQARAGYQSAAAQRGYSELKSEIDGIISERLIGPGTVVNPGQTVLKVAQISPIRLQANVAEADLSRIKVGAKAKVGELPARVSSVSPSLDPNSRTGSVEVVLPNLDGKFLPGQFVSMEIEVGGAPRALIIPIEAVQHSASATAQSFVWVVEDGIARRREIKTGVSDGKRMEVSNGLSEGQRVVTRGATDLQEGDKVTAPSEANKNRGLTIELSPSGFEPTEISVEKGKPVTLYFIRRTEGACGHEVIFPELGIRKTLPLNVPVPIRLNPGKSGDLTFTCEMNMSKGRVVVR